MSALFFSFVSGGTFCVQPRHPRWRSFHFPHWKNSSGKFHSFNMYVKPVYRKVLKQKFAFALVSMMHPRIKVQGVECLKRRFCVCGCLIMIDYRCKLGVLNQGKISNYLHLWNMFIYLVICFSTIFSFTGNLTFCNSYFIVNNWVENVNWPPYRLNCVVEWNVVSVFPLSYL